MKKYLFIIILFTLYAPKTEAAVAFVQRATSLDTSGTSVSFGALVVTSGNFLTVGFRFGNTSAQGISDNNSGTWRIAKNGEQNTTIFYSEDHAGGSTIVTVTLATSATLRGQLYEFSGIVKSNSLDQVNSAGGTSSNITSGNITTTKIDELVLSFNFWDNTTTTFSVGTFNGATFIKPSGSDTTKTNMEHVTISSTRTGTGGGTISTTEVFGSIVASFKAEKDADNSNFWWNFIKIAAPKVFASERQ